MRNLMVCLTRLHAGAAGKGLFSSRCPILGSQYPFETEGGPGLLHVHTGLRLCGDDAVRGGELAVMSTALNALHRWLRGLRPQPIVEKRRASRAPFTEEISVRTAAG